MKCYAHWLLRCCRVGGCRLMQRQKNTKKTHSSLWLTLSFRRQLLKCCRCGLHRILKPTWSPLSLNAAIKQIPFRIQRLRPLLLYSWSVWWKYSKWWYLHKVENRNTSLSILDQWFSGYINAECYYFYYGHEWDAFKPNHSSVNENSPRSSQQPAGSIREASVKRHRTGN